MRLPEPEPGLVLKYTYLWRREFLAGREEGTKDRPSVIVLTTVRESDGKTIVTVLPVTHSAPVDPMAAIEIPSKIKAHLGLDEQRSWVVVSEGNEFVWPGHDVRKIARTGRYAHGFLPPHFFDKIRRAAFEFARGGRGAMSPRT